MTRVLARASLWLYPIAFRRRYGEEMRALLDQTPTRWLTVLDVLRAALIAHLRPSASAAELLGPADRVRASTAGALACWVVFAAAGFGFYETTEDPRFGAAGRAHPLLGLAHLSIQAVALLASAAVLAGALPLILAAVGEARRRPSLRLIVALPAVSVLLFVAATAILVVLARSAHSHGPGTAGGVAFLAWGLAGLACGAVCVVASRAALFSTPLSRWRLVFAFACGSLVTAAMVAIALATALYAIAMPIDASHLAGAPNGPLQAMSTGASLVIQLIVMATAAALAATTTLRGRRASGSLIAGGSPDARRSRGAA